MSWAVFFMNGNKITRLAVQKKNPKRINVYLDGNFAFGLYRDTAAWLEIGQVLTDDKISELLAADKKNEVMIKALDFISYKARTSQETRIKLLKAGYDENLIEKTLEQLSENGLLNDKEYAVQWVEDRQYLKPRSRRMLTYELRKKGISDEMIQSAVENVDDYQSALEIAEKRLYRYDGLSKFEFRNNAETLGSNQHTNGLNSCIEDGFSWVILFLFCWLLNPISRLRLQDLPVFRYGFLLY